MKQGWESENLGNLCDILDSKRKPITKNQRISGKYPYYGATGILDYVDGYLFNEPLILVGEDGAKWGAGENTAFPVLGKIWVNNHAHVLRPHRTKIIDNWLIYFLNYSNLSEFVSGLTVPKLNQENLRKILIPIPPLPEQKRIVAILEDAFARIATAKANTEKNLQNARALFESYLNEVFSQRGEGWNNKNLGDKNFLEIIDGDRGSNYPKLSDFHEEGYCLFLNTKNVRADGFKFENLMFITAEKDKKLRKGKLKRNDIVLTTRGTIGNLGLYSEDIPYENVRINSGMLIFRPNIEVVLPEFLFELLRSGIMKEQISKNTTGAAQPQLPIKILTNFILPIPVDINHQRLIVENVKILYTQTQHLESLYQRKLAALDELKQSLLHQAFNGEL